MEIGERLKQHRLQLGLTQEELAERSELTKGFISQVERDLTSPSVASLEDLLEALGTNLGDFFNEQKPSKIVFKEEDYFVSKDEELGTEISWIVPNAQKNDMEPIRLRIESGGETKIYTPYEGQEFGYVIKGTVSLITNDEEFKIGAGECFYLDADGTRQLKNNTKSTVEVIWISSPPGF